MSAAPTPAEPVSVVVIGASGDLARKKIVPALFALYSQGFLPDSFRLFGFARSNFSHDEFRSALAQNLTCRYVPESDCAQKTRMFLERCFYCRGAYDSADAFLDLFQQMQGQESGPKTNRLFYLATPPSVFTDAARALGDAGFVQCDAERPWSRLVVEKPFGRDRGSSDRLAAELARVFSEGQTYRIDHYLGKEAVQNMMALRFANQVFEPVWNRDYIEHVHIDWREDIGIEGRGGYYDRYGILRDVVQNHLLQVLALIAMDRPAGPGARLARQAKLDMLRCIPPPTLDTVRLGQYAAGAFQGRPRPGYREEEGVPPDSRTPTYATMALTLDHDRWRGVPFRITAGKALNRRATEVRIRFRPVSGILFGTKDDLPRNELILRIQPDEAIHLKVVNKQPGLSMKLVETNLDLKYHVAFADAIPDAYERLLLDVIQGEKSLFIHADELAVAWDIFTPVLHEIEARNIDPFLYPFGVDDPDRDERQFSL